MTARERSTAATSEPVRQNLDLFARIQLARRAAAAETLLTRLLALQEADLGTGHSEMVATVESLAHLKAGQGKIAEAERLYRRALTIRDESSARNLKRAEALEQHAAVLKATTLAGSGVRGALLLKMAVLTVMKNPNATTDDFVATAAQLGVMVTPRQSKRGSRRSSTPT